MVLTDSTVWLNLSPFYLSNRPISHGRVDERDGGKCKDFATDESRVIHDLMSDVLGDTRSTPDEAHTACDLTRSSARLFYGGVLQTGQRI